MRDTTSKTTRHAALRAATNDFQRARHDRDLVVSLLGVVYQRDTIELELPKIIFPRSQCCYLAYIPLQPLHSILLTDSDAKICGGMESRNK